MYFKKLLKIPTPKEMGASRNSLPLRMMTPEETTMCWEDYFEMVKEKYPIRYFFAKTLPEFVRYKLWFPIKVPLNKIYEYVIYNFHPKYKYHLLDLRQPQYNSFKESDYYKYGWREIPDRMLFAMFNLLGEYFKQKPYDVSKDYTLEEINNDVGLKNQYETYQEAREILHWWQVERKKLLNNESKLLNIWYQLRKEKKFNEAKEIFNELNQIETDIKNQTEDMLIRIVKIRENLWN